MVCRNRLVTFLYSRVTAVVANFSLSHVKCSFLYPVETTEEQLCRDSRVQARS